MSTLASRSRSALTGLHSAATQATHSIAAILERVDWLVLPMLAFGVSRLVIFIAALLGDTFLITEEGHWVADPNSPFLSFWAKWDSQWYVQIARDGYWFQPLQQSNVAFFPLYPLYMRLVARFVGGNLILSGFLVSNIALLLALIYLYRLTVLELGDRPSAQRAVFYAAFFPTAFFFNAVYTESLFFLLTIGTMYHARHQQWLAAAVFGLLAAATRNLGILMWAMVMWEWLRHNGWRITQAYRLSAWRNLWNGLRRHWFELLIIAAIPLGLLLYMVFLSSNFGRPFAFVEVQAAWNRQNIGPIAVLARDIGKLMEPQVARWYFTSMLNVGAFFFALALVPFIWHKLGEGYAIYVLLLLLVPMTSSTQSVIRYVLPIFPIYIVLGWWGRRSAVDHTLLASFALLLGVLTSIFVNWYFIA
ncbi:MAG: hypothetical protein M9936_24210 [Caldilinea sp.]|nr:hypothetical protein [Caldilinea sp.]